MHYCSLFGNVAIRSAEVLCRDDIADAGQLVSASFGVTMFDGGTHGALSRMFERMGVRQQRRILKSPSAVQADLVRPFLNCEQAALLAVIPSEGRLENRKWRFHKSSTRLRSQHPLTSSQLNRALTLARARAIEQSAAP